MRCIKILNIILYKTYPEDELPQVAVATVEEKSSCSGSWQKLSPKHLWQVIE